jgi:hypothetical protein
VLVWGRKERNKETKGKARKIHRGKKNNQNKLKFSGCVGISLMCSCLFTSGFIKALSGDLMEAALLTPIKAVLQHHESMKALLMRA